MSKIIANQIQHTQNGATAFTLPTNDGSANQLLKTDGSGALSFVDSAVGGKILQVVQNSFSTQTALNSASYIDTGLTATITPSATSSKVLIFGFIPVNTSHFATPYRVYGWGFNIVRGSTEIKSGSSTLYYQAINDSDINYTVFARPHHFEYLDSPNTTSATTYKIQAKENDVTAGLTICSNSVTAEMILLEVGV
tara:strand:- start:458 stop:1042 length:585 start_codon:yes stop_codon:yes gene_type:complete